MNIKTNSKRRLV